MNIIKSSKLIQIRTSITRDQIKYGETAFIGKCGVGPNHALYLICYNCIVLAANPIRTWEGEATIYLDRYVDLNMQVVEKEQVMGKGDQRRPCCTTREEQNLRDLYAHGDLTFIQYEHKYKALMKRELIKRSGRVIK